jgi:hypothetical protein
MDTDASREMRMHRPLPHEAWPASSTLDNSAQGTNTDESPGAWHVAAGVPDARIAESIFFVITPHAER